MSAVPLTTFSRGYVSINSSNALDHPIVDPRWLTDPRDRELVVAAFRRCRKFIESEPLRQVVTGPEILPGPQYQTDDEIYRYIAETSDAFYAGVGTCAMGKKDDPNSVVDSSARVIGVDSLRVVDASAFPFSIDGQPMATVCEYLLLNVIRNINHSLSIQTLWLRKLQPRSWQSIRVYRGNAECAA